MSKPFFPNKKGNWVIVNDKHQFYNPRSGIVSDTFIASKHLFHEWRTVCWKMMFGFPDGWNMHIEKVELHPTFTPCTVSFSIPKITEVTL